MGFLQLLASLWPFLKEMFVGEKIKASNSSTDADGTTKQVLIKDGRARDNVFYWFMGKMQESKRFLAVVLLSLILSLFINYKVIPKLSVMVLPPRSNEENIKTEAPALKEPREVPTVPHKSTSERDVLFNQTVRELKNLYGESR